MVRDDIVEGPCEMTWILSGDTNGNSAPPTPPSDLKL